MTLALANLVLAAYMAGLIWFVGVVHYPLLARVGRAQWAVYERGHRVRTTFVVAPAMLAQVPVALLLLASPPDGEAPALAVANLARRRAVRPSALRLFPHGARLVAWR